MSCWLWKMPLWTFGGAPLKPRCIVHILVHNLETKCIFCGWEGILGAGTPWGSPVISVSYLLYYILYFKQRLCEYTLSICVIFIDQILCNQCKGENKKGHRTSFSITYIWYSLLCINTVIKRFYLLRKEWYCLETIFTSLFFHHLQCDNCIIIF